MSDASSSPADWAHFYNLTSTAAEYSTVVTTASGTGPAVQAFSGPTGIEGRVGKPSSARRRSRASRRAPTTLLNTDAANFRAMVQQFTAAPPGTYSCARQPGSATGGGPTISFELGFNDVQTRQPAAVGPIGQYLLHGQQYQQPQQHERAVFAHGGDGNGNDSFFHGFNGDNGADGFIFLDGMGGPAASGECRRDGYFL